MTGSKRSSRKAAERRVSASGPWVVNRGRLAIDNEASWKLTQNLLIADFSGQHRSVIQRILLYTTACLVDLTDPFNFGISDRNRKTLSYLERGERPVVAKGPLKDALLRIIVLREQLVHSASSAGGKLNRGPLSDNLQVLHHFIPLASHVIIENGLTVDWPPLCFPPVDETSKGHMRRIAQGAGRSSPRRRQAGVM